jgi:hypothetical protein
MLVGTGTFFLLVREPNVLIGDGIAIFAYASAFKTGFIWFLKRFTADEASEEEPASTI